MKWAAVALAPPEAAACALINYRGLDEVASADGEELTRHYAKRNRGQTNGNSNGEDHHDRPG